MKVLKQVFSLCIGLGMTSFVSAQSIDVENHTPCNFVVKVNLTNSSVGCPMGAGPVKNCPGTSSSSPTITTIIASPPASTNVVAYGVQSTTVPVPPVIVGKPSCHPITMVMNDVCGTGLTTFTFNGRLLVIN